MTSRYASQLLAEVLDHAHMEGQEAFLAEAFTDLVLDGLEEESLWPDYQLSFLKRRGLELSAWGLDDVNEALYLSITDFDRSDEARSFLA